MLYSRFSLAGEIQQFLSLGELGLSGFSLVWIILSILSF